MFFIAVAYVLSLLWQLKVQLTYNGKVKIILYCYLTADILTRVLQKCPLNSSLPNILFLSKPQKFHTKKKKQKKKKKKNHLLRSHMGNKAETLQKCLLH